MRTWIAVTNDARTQHFSAYTQSDAYQQAVEWAGDGGLRSFDEL